MEKFIQKAIKRPGALTKKAKKAGGVSKETGKIKEEYLEKAAHSKDTRTRKQAVLAKTLRKLSKHK